MFGDPEVMPVKVIWDYTYYWGVLCQLFFQRRLTDLAIIARLRRSSTIAKALNLAMQDFMREWSQLSAKRNAAVMLDQAALALVRRAQSRPARRARRGGVPRAHHRGRALLDTLAREIVTRALATLSAGRCGRGAGAAERSGRDRCGPAALRGCGLSRGS